MSLLCSCTLKLCALFYNILFYFGARSAWECVCGFCVALSRNNGTGEKPRQRKTFWINKLVMSCLCTFFSFSQIILIKARVLRHNIENNKIKMATIESIHTHTHTHTNQWTRMKHTRHIAWKIESMSTERAFLI